jgi:hypothetical protein
MLNNEIFSRCISNLILVIKEEVVKSLLLDSSRTQIIPIYGLCIMFLGGIGQVRLKQGLVLVSLD